VTRDWLARTAASYDTVAESYLDRLGGYPDDDAHDRALFGLFAELVARTGERRVVDAGCGPGQVTAYLATLGLDAFGIDLSPGMVDLARRRNPGLGFDVGSMTDLDVGTGSVGGFLAWYSLIHVPDAEVAGVLAEAARVLRPGGVALLGFHVGDATAHKTQGYGGHPMDVHVVRRPVERVAGWLEEAGFVVDEQIVRDPSAEVPHGRLLGRKR
jgi:SAM-dependent methyltransferase